MLFAVIKAEAGQLAAQESARPEELPVGASHALVYEDTKPFKRDIAVVYFPDSRRLVQLVYPLRRRENVLQQDILPGLRVVSEQSPAPWSVFGLTCLSPVGLELERHRLNAGDLSLTFLGKRRRGVLQSWASIREIAAPGLALKKSSIRGWMRTMQRPDDRFYKPVAGVEEAELAVGGRSFRADVLPMVRRRRYFFLPGPKGCVTLACHDTNRDRLVLVHGTDETMVRGLAGTMGVRLAEGVMLEGE